MSVEPEQTGNKPAISPAHNSNDHVLEMLVEHVNRIPGLGIGVTLQVGGTLVSGSLVGGGDYFDAFSETFANSVSDEETRESYRQVFSDLGNIYKTEPQQDDPPPRYFHLKDAKFYAANGNPVISTGVLWRGRISEVSGFTLGTLTPTK